jgi:DNA repair exonuclease SbcCD ATPase subunit
MTQPIEPTPAPEAPAPEATPKVEWTPPASQADLDRIVQDRLARERAKFADYDELREKAQFWDEIESASQTEYERTQDALTAAQERYEAAQQRIVAAELRAAGVPGELIEDLDLGRFIDGDGEVAQERIDALSQKYQAISPRTAQRMAPNPAQGTSAQPPLSLSERVAEATKAGDLKTVMRLKAQMAVGSNTPN